MQWEMNVLFPEPVIPITAMRMSSSFSEAIADSVGSSEFPAIVDRCSFAVFG